MLNQYNIEEHEYNYLMEAIKANTLTISDSSKPKQDAKTFSRNRLFNAYLTEFQRSFSKEQRVRTS